MSDSVKPLTVKRLVPDRSDPSNPYPKRCKQNDVTDYSSSDESITPNSDNEYSPMSA